MKAIMISDKPKWCALMMNGKKTKEVRKNKALYKAIQKLIDEYGYAEIYVYCSKINKKHYHLIESIDTDTGKTEYEIDYYIGSENYLDYCYEGKVAFKFRCYKVEEIEDCVDVLSTKSLDCLELLHESCLKYEELHDYLPSREDDSPRGYVIHISDLEIFDRPKELSEFKTLKRAKATDCFVCDVYQLTEMCIGNRCLLSKPLTKAPQNMVYIEV